MRFAFPFALPLPFAFPFPPSLLALGVVDKGAAFGLLRQTVAFGVVVAAVTLGARFCFARTVAAALFCSGPRKMALKIDGE